MDQPSFRQHRLQFGVERRLSKAAQRAEVQTMSERPATEPLGPQAEPEDLLEAKLGAVAADRSLQGAPNPLPRLFGEQM